MLYLNCTIRLKSEMVADASLVEADVSKIAHDLDYDDGKKTKDLFQKQKLPGMESRI